MLTLNVTIMMRKKYICKKLLLLCMGTSLLTTTGCTDKFDEWNTNPDQATEEMLNRDDLAVGSFFVQMQRNVFALENLTSDGGGVGADTYQTIDNLTGASFAGYTGACNIWFANSNFLTYNMFVDWRNVAFEHAYLYVMSPWGEIAKKAEEQKRPQVAALADIVKVLAMSRVTDMYGPIPYTRFGSGGFAVPYDSQEVVYDSFFSELDNAIDILYDMYQKDATVKVLERYDFVYSGNMESWIRFANTLKLRLAMRIVYANPAKAEQMANEAVAHPIGVMTKVTDAARLQHSDNFIYRHPLFVIGTGEFNDARMGATMDSYLNGYNDPRISSYFRMASTGKYTGIRTGIVMNREKYSTSSDFSDLAAAGGDDVVWMNPAEAYFLRAEGAARGWNMGATARELYESGVRTSFEFLGASGVDAYLKNETNKPVPYTDPANSGNSIGEGSPLLGTITIKWNDEADLEEKLERIITQKWIALYPDGQEAWSEFRRTAYPKVFPVAVNNSGGTINTEKQVCRIPFPASEYRNNAENVRQAVTLLSGDDNGGTPLWWDKKN